MYMGLMGILHRLNLSHMLYCSCSGDERCKGYQYNSGVCQIIRTFSPHDQNHTFVASDANLVFKKGR